MIKFNQGQLVKIEKIVDNFNGRHPNGINFGYIKYGWFNKLELNQEFCLNSLITTKVIWISDDYSKFKTINSTYTIEDAQFNPILNQTYFDNLKGINVIVIEINKEQDKIIFKIEDKIVTESLSKCQNELVGGKYSIPRFKTIKLR